MMEIITIAGLLMHPVEASITTFGKTYCKEKAET